MVFLAIPRCLNYKISVGSGDGNRNVQPDFSRYGGELVDKSTTFPAWSQWMKLGNCFFWTGCLSTSYACESMQRGHG